MDISEDAIRTEFERLMIAIQEWAESYLIDLRGVDCQTVTMWNGEIKPVESAYGFLRALIDDTQGCLNDSRAGLRPWLSKTENPESE